jgi:hypothetical protein
MFTGQLPEEWDQKVRAELDPGETILWFGQPRPFGMLLVSLPIMLFAIPWTGFSIFWICAASGFKVPNFSKVGPQMFFPLFGIPFVLIGFLMLLSPLWISRAAKKTGYVITNKRAIIFQGGWNGTIRSIDKEQFHSISRRERSNGRGDIIFDGLVDLSQQNTNRETSLRDVENVKEVESILRSLVKSR